MQKARFDPFFNLIGIFSVFYVHPDMSPALFASFYPVKTWPNAGPLFPMLFVTIACGAISGFHSLIASGTSCKQLDNETHACQIGYGSMLTEGLVAVLVLICVGAALSQTELHGIIKTNNPIAAFAAGYGRLSAFLLGDYAPAFAILALNTFILTTLDSATRITRYLTMELFGIKNKYTATLIVLIISGALALSGQWQKIWPAFGTANQLIAGLALLVASCWLIKRKGMALITLIPAIFMLITTTAAFVYQIVISLAKDQPDYLITGIALILILLSITIFWEAIKEMFVTSRVVAGRK